MVAFSALGRVLVSKHGPTGTSPARGLFSATAPLRDRIERPAPCQTAVQILSVQLAVTRLGRDEIRPVGQFGVQDDLAGVTRPLVGGRAALNRFLEPANNSVTLATLHKIAVAVGGKIRLEPV